MIAANVPLAQKLQRAVRALSNPPLPPGWNHDELSDLLGPGPRQPAAVLVAIVPRGQQLCVLFTRRTEQLSQHAGQVSFPGGRIEAADADAVGAALRETREEVGIGPDLVQPFGYLDSFETISGFCVVPVVGYLDAGYRAAPDPNEVAEVFEAPLEFFLEPNNLQRLRMDYRGRPREVFEYRHAGHRIWGATAAMLVNLARRMETAQ